MYCMAWLDFFLATQYTEIKMLSYKIILWCFFVHIDVPN